MHLDLFYFLEHVLLAQLTLLHVPQQLMEPLVVTVIIYLLNGLLVQHVHHQLHLANQQLYSILVYQPIILLLLLVLKFNVLLVQLLIMSLIAITQLMQLLVYQDLMQLMVLV